MSGMLTVVGNPRGRRKGRKKARRRVAAKAASKPRRRRRTANPRSAIRRRRGFVARRRRHRNPALFGGGLTADFLKGVTGVGIGAIGAKLIANAAKNTLMPTASPMVKLAIQAAVGVVGGFVVGKVLRQPGLGKSIAIGAGAITALDAYALWIQPTLAASMPLLSDYEIGTLEGWAPQAGLQNYEVGTLQGNNLYTGGIYG